MLRDLLAPDAARTNRRERSLACKERGNAEDTAVQQDLAELEFNPVPDEENLEGAECRGEGEDAG